MLEFIYHPHGLAFVGMCFATGLIGLFLFLAHGEGSWPFNKK